MSDKKAKEITKGGLGMLEDELRKERKEGKIETASNFIKMGLLTLEQIAQGTGLPLEELKRLFARL